MAEDREARLVQSEQVRLTLEAQLATCEKECEALRQKHDFQVEVCQRIARHYRTLKAGTSHFQSMYAQVSSSLEESRQLFMNMEHEMMSLKAYESKVVDLLAAKHESVEEKEKSLRLAEHQLGELHSQLMSSNAMNDELKSLLDTEKSLHLDKITQVAALEKERLKLSELLKEQSILIEKDQSTLCSLLKELSSLSDTSKTDSEVIDVEKCSIKLEELNLELRSQVTILELKLEESSTRRSESASHAKNLVDSLIQQRDEAYMSLAAAEKRSLELEKENADLRTLLTKKHPLAIHTTYDGGFSRTCASTNSSSYHHHHQPLPARRSSSHGSPPSASSSCSLVYVTHVSPGCWLLRL